MKTIFIIFLNICWLTTHAQIIEFRKSEHLRVSPEIIEFENDLQDKRIVFLGDIIHGESNIDSLRAVVIEYLISEQGFNTLAFESGIYDLFIANKALKDGESVENLLSESIYSVWTGPSLYPLVDVINEYRDSLRLIGFDPKFSGSQYSDIDLELSDFLEQANIDYDPLLPEKFQKYCEALALWDFGDIDEKEFTETLKKLNKLLKNIDNLSSSDELLIWKQILFSVQELHIYLKEEEITKLTSETWEPSNANTRDSLMAVNLKFFMDLYPDAKIICWGASAHFARSLNALSDSSIQAFKPMGSYFGEEAVTIGAMGYTGEFGWPTNINKMPKLPENSVEYKLSSIGLNTALVKLSSMTNEMPLYSSAFVEMDPIMGDWTQVFDWVIFVNKVLPKISAYHKKGKKQPLAESEEHEPTDYSILKRSKKNILILRNKGELIEGTIYDGSNNPVPYSSVALKGTSYGVVSDHEGSFSIRAPNPELDTLIFSNVAYEQLEMPLRNAKSNSLSIVLKEKTVELPELIVSPGKDPAYEILLKAIENIGENYITEPFSIKLLNQKWKIDTAQSAPVIFHHILEAYYPNGYNDNKFDGLFQPLQSRKGILKNEPDDFSYASYKITGLEFIGIGLIDVVLNRRNSFLDKKRHKFFNFEIEGFEDGVYALSFTCDRINSKTTGYAVKNAKIYRGKVFINSKDYAITRFETELIWNINEISGRVFDRMDIKQETLLFTIKAEYIKTNGKYHISYASRFENYDDFGFSEYHYFDTIPGEKTSFENGLTNSNSKGEIDWKEIIKKVGNIGYR